MGEEAINPKMLTLARESQRYTQSALARAVEAAQGTISKLENGQGVAPEPVLAKIANVLRYSVGLFYEQFEPREQSLFFYRKRLSLPALDLRAVMARAEILRFQIGKLLRSVDVPENRIPQIDPLSDGTSPTEAAKEIRRHWGMPRGRVDNVAALLESAGVLVISCDFGSRLIDGFSSYDPMSPIPPMIFLNSMLPAERTRFTAAHELGHLVLHYHQRFPSATSEDEANEFASEFLMPAAEIRGQLGGLSLDVLASLKPQWKVSMAALLMRAERLGRITPYRLKSLRIQMARLGYRTREPLELPPEDTTVIRQMVSVHTDHLGYSDDAVAETICLPLERYYSEFKGERQKLRLLPAN